MDVSVIVLNWNGKEYLKDCFDSLQNQTYKNYELILVDMDSTDSSVEFVRENYPEVKIIKNKENLGFAEGNNMGILASRGRYILTLNNDTKVDENWISELLRTAQKDEKIGMCASKMLSFDGKRIDSCGIEIRKSGRSFNIGHGDSNLEKYSEKREVFGPCAGAALYKKKMLDEIGLFDNDFFAYLEDVDLAWRANLAGWRCVFVPSAIVYHMHSATGSRDPKKKLYLLHRNWVFLVLKNFPRKLLLKYGIYFLFWNFGTLFYYLTKGRGLLVLRAKLDVLKSLRNLLRKRRDVQEKSVVLTREVEGWFSIK